VREPAKFEIDDEAQQENEGTEGTQGTAFHRAAKQQRLNGEEEFLSVELSVAPRDLVTVSSVRYRMCDCA
jgi:hypothetical protein